jgi:hypothetical protein
MITSVCAHASLTLQGRHVINARFALVRSEQGKLLPAHEHKLRGDQI